MKLLPKYTDKIIYEQLDIFDSLKKLQPQNNVVLCRNVLPYLSNEKKVKFIDLLARKLDPSSLVVIGAFDNGHIAFCVFGKAITSLIDSSPINNAHNLSNPIARPPCGGAP